MTTPILADVHMRAESHVKVRDSCNCCFFGRKVVVMDLPTTDKFERKGSHSSYTITTVTTETFRESQ